MQDQQHQLALHGGAQDGIMQQQGTQRHLPYGEGGFAMAPLLRAAVLLVLAVPSAGTQLKRRQVPFSSPTWSPAPAYSPAPAAPYYAMAAPGVSQGYYPPYYGYPNSGYPSSGYPTSRYPTSGYQTYAAFSPAPAYSPAPAFSPAPAQVPAPAPGPLLPQISGQTCEALVGQVGADLCQTYDWGFELGAGCACFLSGLRCPEAPNAEAQGFTGGVVPADPLDVPNTDGPRITCFYRQWYMDPANTGPLRDMQEWESKDRTLNYVADAYGRAQANAEKAAYPMKMLSKPFFPQPLRMEPSPAAAPAPAAPAAPASAPYGAPMSAPAVAAAVTPQFGPVGQLAHAVQPKVPQPPGLVAAAGPWQQAQVSLPAVAPLQKAQPPPPPGLAMPAAPPQQPQQAAWPPQTAASQYAQPPMGQSPPDRKSVV